jgi:hypothetical protein
VMHAGVAADDALDPFRAGQEEARVGVGVVSDNSMLPDT